ncbi:MAG: hypothetical protein J5I93_01425, partial [Pirellulaceae bacterium]|nr:hypothetical protein [Pirellulaceae bacterium]
PSGAAAPANSAVASRPAVGLRLRDIESDKEIVTEAVQTIGNETLYRRGKLWIAASAKEVDPDKDAGQIKLVKRFTPEYFQLIQDNSAAENAVLARQQADDELLIKLRGQVYRIQ